MNILDNLLLIEKMAGTKAKVGIKAQKIDIEKLLFLMAVSGKILANLLLTKLIGKGFQ